MITEDQLEQLCLEWFKSIGYDYICGYDIAPDGDSPERSDYRQIILHGRLLSRLEMINPHIPVATLEQVALQIAKPETPILIKNNKAFHQLLLEGGKVEFKQDDTARTDYVQLVDFSNKKPRHAVGKNKTFEELSDVLRPTHLPCARTTHLASLVGLMPC